MNADEAELQQRVAELVQQQAAAATANEQFESTLDSMAAEHRAEMAAFIGSIQ